MRKTVIIITMVVVLAAGLYFTFGRTAQRGPQTTYITVPIEEGNLKAEINSTGTIKPRVEVLVGSQVSGTIKELRADFESVVKEGQLIALIDPDSYIAKVKQAKANLLSAQAKLKKSEVTLKDLLRTLRRREELLKSNSISQNDYDTAQTNAEAAQAQVEVDKAAIAQMEANLEEVELQLKHTQIIAPVNGVVTARNMDIGQTVTASFQTPVLFKIAKDLTRMQAHTSVDEADIGRVRLGQKAVFTVPAYPDELFTAAVTQIRNDPQIQQNVVTYNVILDVANDDLKLRPGMTTNVQIQLSEVHKALIVSERAFQFSPRSSQKLKSDPGSPKSNQRRLWKLEDGSRLQPLNVGIGIVAVGRAQIFSTALRPGDRVVVEEVSKKKHDTKKPGIRLRF